MPLAPVTRSESKANGKTNNKANYINCKKEIDFVSAFYIFFIHQTLLAVCSLRLYLCSSRTRQVVIIPRYFLTSSNEFESSALGESDLDCTSLHLPSFQEKPILILGTTYMTNKKTQIIIIKSSTSSCHPSIRQLPLKCYMKMKFCTKFFLFSTIIIVTERLQGTENLIKQTV